MSIIFFSSSRSIHLFHLISFISFVMSQSPELMPFSCPHSSNNTASDAFTSSLNLLFDRVPNEAYSLAYYQTTVGKYPDMVYGLYLCRGDRKREVCENCADLAIDNLQKDCKGTKEAIIWYDDCMVRYSDKSFSSKMETSPSNCSKNKQTFTEPEKLRKTVNQSLYEVIPMAASETSSKKYAEYVANVSSNDKLYCFVQCIPDLSIEECRACLMSSAASILSCYQDKQGARFLNPSCNIRFELYPFFLTHEVPPAGPLGPIAHRGSKESKILIITFTTISAFLILVAVLFAFTWKMKRNKRDKERKAINQDLLLLEMGGGEIGNDNSDILRGEKQMESQEFPLFPLDLTLKATRHFSDENKLGEGGFGPVYKGILADGKEIAVKRLSRTSGQGIQEFKTEVTLIAKLQHKNLVRLLGCCLGRNELLLIYEYMPNKSLDFLLFDSTRSALLDWEKRNGIIHGIARGLLYLHEDSRLKIIHRDLKASNILLDHEMNPKISDFGMARIFCGNQHEANTNRVVGTYGYMAPEYAMEGLFSVKSDVFSFGVLLLEIISGKKNSGFYLSEQSRCLLSHAWILWLEGNALALIDPVLKQSYIPDEVLKCIHIALLCVQEDPAERPIMSSVVVMLASDTITLPQPAQPPFSIGRGALKLSQSLSETTVGCSISEGTTSGVSPR